MTLTKGRQLPPLFLSISRRRHSVEATLACGPYRLEMAETQGFYKALQAVASRVIAT
jgi:hypothetical protein